MGLGAFVVKRLVGAAAVLVFVSAITFFLVHLAPGNPVVFALGQRAGQNPQLVAQLTHQYGLDQSIFVQYLNYVKDFLHGYLGPSYFDPDPTHNVNTILGQGLPITLWLGFLATLVALIIGIPLGVLAAVRHNRLLSDNFNMGVMMALYAVPPLFLIAILRFGVIVFGLSKHAPFIWGSGWGGFTDFHYLLLPVLVYASGIVGLFARSMRSFMLEVLSQQYIRTAKAKGLAYWRIVFVQAGKNCLVPFASVFGPTVAFLVVGAFVVETVFGIPGIAQQTVSSTINNDYNVTLATTILLAIVVVIVNALTDLFYAIVDPRVRL